MKASVLLVWLVCVSASAHAQLADFRISFDSADSIACHYRNYPLRNLPILSHSLTKSLRTDVEKFRSIYVWTCTNITSNYRLYSISKYKRKKYARQPARLVAWNRSFSRQVHQELIDHRRTICTGYAYVVRELARHAGIECVIVDGYGRTGQSNVTPPAISNHSWNAVKLNGKWYLCDPTWTSGEMHAEKLPKKFDDNYFLLPPEQFALNHFPLDTTWLLSKGDIKNLDQFISAPLVFNTFFKTGITNLSISKFVCDADLGGSLPISFSTPCETMEWELQIGTEKPIKPSAGAKGEMNFDCRFSKKGKYPAQLKLNSMPVLAFEIRVK